MKTKISIHKNSIVLDHPKYNSIHCWINEDTVKRWLKLYNSSFSDKSNLYAAINNEDKIISLSKFLYSMAGNDVDRLTVSDFEKIIKDIPIEKFEELGNFLQMAGQFLIDLGNDWNNTHSN